MADEVTHDDNDTPTATDDDVKRMDKDTVPQPGDSRPGESVDEGATADAEDTEDPKAGHSPV
ncbi:MAG: hypothetical protein QOG42_734 [Solirubrobacteraceae bacterium]|jgi:hypothetical protein|nr:hypothetical protein [Solirubrobacteraceae bacterium]